MNDRRNGIPDLHNGEHRLLQKQIDMLHEDIRYIRDNIHMSVEANSRSKTNFTLIKIMIPIIIGLSGGLGYLGYLIFAGG